MKPEPKPISALPSALPIELIRIAARNALKRSAKRVASGTQKIRTTIGSGQHDPDRGRVEALVLEPQREERHAKPGGDAQGRVERRQTRRES